MKRAITLLAFLTLSTCGEDDEALDIAGRWVETWSCTEQCTGAAPTNPSGETSMELTRDGTSVTRTDDDGTTWTGTLDDNVLTLETSSGTYSEQSTFTFDDSSNPPNDFTIESSYTAGDCTGDCTGTGTRE